MPHRFLHLDEHTPAPGVVSLDLSGDLDVYTVDYARKRLRAMLALQSASEPAERRAIVVNLEPCTFMDSTGLGLFVTLNRLAGQFGVPFRIATGAQHLRLFRITGLYRVFELYLNLSQAVGGSPKDRIRDRV